MGFCRRSASQQEGLSGDNWSHNFDPKTNIKVFTLPRYPQRYYWQQGTSRILHPRRILHAPGAFSVHGSLLVSGELRTWALLSQVQRSTDQATTAQLSCESWHLSSFIMMLLRFQIMIPIKYKYRILILIEFVYKNQDSDYTGVTNIYAFLTHLLFLILSPQHFTQCCIYIYF